MEVEVEVNTERAAALADYTGKSRSMRGFGLLTDSQADDWAASLLAKLLYLLGCAAGEVWRTRRIPSLFIKLRSVFG